MERLWTPWRMAYVKDVARLDGCIFCELPAQQTDRENLILARGEKTFVIMNKFPYNSGHLIVSGYRHCAKYEELSPQEHADSAAWTARCLRALSEVYAPDGFNIGVNQGRPAGAGIPDHLHTHIVPRWAGDANFMTTVGETKVLPEALHETYDKIQPILNALY